MKNYFKLLPRKISFSIGFLLIFILGIYLNRNVLLRHIAEKQITKLEQQYKLDIRYGKLQLHGINCIYLGNLSVVPAERDTLLTLQSLQIQFDLWNMIWGEFDVERTDMDGLRLSFIKQNKEANYDFLFTSDDKEHEPQPAEAATTNYAERINKVLSLLYKLLPENGTLKNLCISERKNNRFVTFTIPSFQIVQNRFQSEIEICEDTLQQQWITKGSLNRSQQHIQAKLYAPRNEHITLPYLHRRLGADISFDSLTYSLTQERESSTLTTLRGKAKVDGLQVYHASLSPEVIVLNRGGLEYSLHIAPHGIELDSTSTVRFNDLSFHPYLKAEKADSTWHLTASVNKAWFPARQLFGSLPKGLFENLDGLQTSGELAYHFFFDVDFAQPDSLKLESELNRKGFRIERFGLTDLRKMAEEFTYTAYEHDQPVRSFPVGPSWEHYTPLDSIPRLLQMTIMQSEDNAFFYHRGFLPDALREALIQDLKVKRFARGGSTITMQLIKNVFLNRHKNIARKLEEALIVWLIENEHLTSKERMYEVYLNIIEWGPLIYGVHEAADFYFSKRPSQLSLEECIFLAHTIPNPKHFKWSFTEDLKLKESMAEYYRLIAERLAQKGVISEEQALSIRPEIELRGKAREFFRTEVMPAEE